MTKHKSLSERFNTLERSRTGKLRRARSHVELVMPTLLPQTGSVFDSELPVPWSSFMSEAVNNLAARVVSVLFPLNDIPFFEIQIPLEGFDSETAQATRDEVRRYERLVIDRINSTNFRPRLHEAIQHLLVVGDVLLIQQPNLQFRVVRLDNYVVQRYHDGTWFEIIMREAVDPDNKPPELDELPTPKGTADSSAVAFDPANPNQQWLYTSVKWNTTEEVFEFSREFGGTKFDDTTMTVSPFFPLRWRSMAGEHYGRSEVEDAFGDVTAVDGLMKAIIDGAALNAEYRWELDPFSMLTVDDFNDSINGDVLPVRAGELRPSQFNNMNQVVGTSQVMGIIEARIGRRFLMNSAVQPTGERVTARQVTILAEELESGLGGMLSVAAGEIQIPMVRHTMQVMADSNELPASLSDFITDDTVMKIRIRAGLEVLKREAEAERFNIVMDRAQALPESAIASVKWNRLLRRWLTAFGLDSEEFVKTDEELAAEQEAQMLQQQATQMQQQAQQAIPRQ